MLQLLPDDSQSRSLFVRIRPRRGAVAVLVAIMLPVLLMMAALAINVSQIGLVRAELRVAGDAAARAAARELSLTQSLDDAADAAIEAASRNMVAGGPLTLEPSDVQFGLSTPASPAQIAGGSGPYAFTPHADSGPINSLRITVNAGTGSSGGSVPYLFAPFLTDKSFETSMSAGAMQIDRDIVLVVDCSGSMGEPADDNDPNKLAYDAAVDELWEQHKAGEITYGDYKAGKSAVAEAYPFDTRWGALNKAVDQFLEALEDTVPEEKIGLAWFHTSAGIAQELTTNDEDIRAAMDKLGPNGWTAIGLGLQEGVNALTNPKTASSFAQKVVVVMTDGKHNRSVWPDTVASQVVQEQFIVIHTITFGTGADQVLMQKVADIGGGRSWHANEPGALADAYDAIAKDIPTVLTD